MLQVHTFVIDFYSLAPILVFPAFRLLWDSQPLQTVTGRYLLHLEAPVIKYGSPILTSQKAPAVLLTVSSFMMD